MQPPFINKRLLRILFKIATVLLDDVMMMEQAEPSRVSLAWLLPVLNFAVSLELLIILGFRDLGGREKRHWVVKNNSGFGLR